MTAHEEAGMFELEGPREVPRFDALVFWAGCIALGIALGLVAVTVF